MSGGYLSQGGNCLGGICLGVIVWGVIVRGVIVLIPFDWYFQGSSYV